MTADTDRLDPERRLALSYAPAARRAGLAALWNLDAAIGSAIAGGTQPLVKSIKLAWWRERLDELAIAGVPAEPALQAAARELLPAGVDGARLAAITEGWDVLASADHLGPNELELYSARRGGLLFRLSAVLLGGHESEPVLVSAGRAWALVDLARRSSDPEEAARALVAAAAALDDSPVGVWPRHLRSLGMLAMLARRDAASRVAALERQGSPARILRMIRHRFTGQ
jgi:phytoene synthase